MPTPDFRISVRQKRQNTSAGDFIVYFDADVELVSDCSAVEIASVSGVLPESASQSEIQLAADSIRRGAQTALQSHALGARISITYVIIHPVDLSPAKFEQLTREAILQELSI